MKHKLVFKPTWRMGSRAASAHIAIVAELFPEVVGLEPQKEMTQAQKDFVKQMQQHKGE